MTMQEQGVGAPSGPVAPEGVNHLVLNVKDLERAHDFWTRIMGFRQVGELKRREDGRGLKMRFYQAAGGSHHDLALAQVVNPEAVPDPAPWSMAGRATGINHMAITWPDRDSWLR